MKKQKFQRAGYWQYSKLGLRRNKKIKYRKAKGCDNKVRLKMKGHLRNVSIGFRKEKEKRGLVRGLKPIRIFNIEDLKKIKSGEVAILAKIGNKKRLEIANYASEKNIKINNFNSKRFLEKIEQIRNLAEKEKTEKQKKKKNKEKKSSEIERKTEKMENKLEHKKEDLDQKEDIREVKK